MTYFNEIKNKERRIAFRMNPSRYSVQEHHQGLEHSSYSNDLVPDLPVREMKFDRETMENFGNGYEATSSFQIPAENVRCFPTSIETTDSFCSVSTPAKHTESRIKNTSVKEKSIYESTPKVSSKKTGIINDQTFLHSDSMIVTPIPSSKKKHHSSSSANKISLCPISDISNMESIPTIVSPGVLSSHLSIDSSYSDQRHASTSPSTKIMKVRKDTNKDQFSNEIYKSQIVTSRDHNLDQDEEKDHRMEPNPCTNSLNQQQHFPTIVHSMVTETAKINPSIIDWVEDGEAFKIMNIEKLSPILRSFFRHTKYSSLQRQLNMYGFKKHLKGRYKGAFHHPDFHRDRGSLVNLALIQRRAPPKIPSRKKRKDRGTTYKVSGSIKKKVKIKTEDKATSIKMNSRRQKRKAFIKACEVIVKTEDDSAKESAMDEDLSIETNMSYALFEAIGNDTGKDRIELEDCTFDDHQIDFFDNDSHSCIDFQPYPSTQWVPSIDSVPPKLIDMLQSFDNSNNGETSSEESFKDVLDMPSNIFFPFEDHNDCSHLLQHSLTDSPLHFGSYSTESQYSASENSFQKFNKFPEEDSSAVTYKFPEEDSSVVTSNLLCFEQLD